LQVALQPWSKSGWKESDPSVQLVLIVARATVVVGMESLELLQQDLKIASTFKMMTETEKSDMLEKTKKYGENGIYELYKTSPSYDSGR
jgi:hypothetical protein